jgi:hypothetical protein
METCLLTLSDNNFLVIEGGGDKSRYGSWTLHSQRDRSTRLDLSEKWYQRDRSYGDLNP